MSSTSVSFYAPEGSREFRTKVRLNPNVAPNHCLEINLRELREHVRSEHDVSTYIYAPLEACVGVLTEHVRVVVEALIEHAGRDAWENLRRAIEGEPAVTAGAELHELVEREAVRPVCDHCGLAVIRADKHPAPVTTLLDQFPHDWLHVESGSFTCQQGGTAVAAEVDGSPRVPDEAIAQ